MTIQRLLPVLTLAVLGCATDPGDPDDVADPGDPDAGDPAGDPFEVTDPTDADGDGVPEQLEDYLMATFGPELRLPPDDVDWTRPASVDWYLPRVKLRFDHAGCPDDGDNLLDVGAITGANIHAQSHYLKETGLGLCRHSTAAADQRFSNKKHLEFFLQAEDDALVHAGVPPARSSEWRTYVQVRKSSYVRADGKAAAYDLQVWYFFPYNDFVASANHEGDWEHMTVSVSADYKLVSVFYATHDNGQRVDELAKLEYAGGTHVVGYIADGSHATYPTVGTHATTVPGVSDHTYAGGPVWKSWASYKNIGQVGKILNGQAWAAYGGRWGEVGETSFTSGPPGPMFNGKWDTRNEYAP
ncbi:MAG TPA: Vps62-related protein [Kofleriaceae bacterium]|nr:Vps62-related protein [Kofleriaceae bacterium]